MSNNTDSDSGDDSISTWFCTGYTPRKELNLNKRGTCSDDEDDRKSKSSSKKVKAGVLEREYPVVVYDPNRKKLEHPPPRERNEVFMTDALIKLLPPME